MSGRIALITPTYEGDAALCADLNRSILEFTTGWTHYIVADRRDLGHFRSLAGPRTEILAKEDLLPPGFRRVPHSRRWMSRYSPRPLGGWLVQQVAKFATAGLLDEEVLVCIDSDVILVGELTDDDFLREGRIRLYRSPGGIHAGMSRHVEWHRNACRLLGVPADDPPMPDYIAATVSWSRSLVRSMTERIESVTGSPWYAAIARTPQFSEGLVYGAYVTKVLGDTAPVWVDETDHTLSYHDMTPLQPSAVDGFVGGFGPGDRAVMISSHSATPMELRRLVGSRLSGGRLS